MKQLFIAAGSLKKLAISTTAKNTYLIFLGNLLAVFFAFLFTVSAVRLLSISDFGIYSALWSFLLLISDISDIGIGTSLARFLPPLANEKVRQLSFFKTAFYLQLFIAIILSFGIFMLSGFLSQIIFHDLKLQIAVKIISLGIFASIMSNFLLLSLQAKQKFPQAAFYSAAGGAFRVLLILPLFFMSIISVENLIWTQVLSFLLLGVLGIYFIKLDFLKLKRTAGDVIRLITFAVYLGIARGLTAISSKLDVIMIIALTNSVEAGVYSIASRVISVYPVLAGSFSSVLAPKFASIKNKQELNLFLKKVILATMLLITTIILLIVIAQPFLVILFTQKAYPAVASFRLLLISMIFFVASIPAVSLSIYYLRKPQILTINSIIQLAIVVIGNFILIPKLGGSGAAISLMLAFAITFATTSLLSLYYLKKIEQT